MLSGGELARKVGRKVLFIGTEAYRWSVADFGKAARNARALGFDTISPKRADGQNIWYQSVGHMQLERQACLSEGVGYLPFSYMYGPVFGNQQIDREAAIAQEMAHASDGLVCIDMEIEWNGKEADASYLAGKLKNFPGDIILSTWADPVYQNWTGVLHAMTPVISAFGPQMYTNWLSLQEGEFAGIPHDCIFPEIDAEDFFNGANNPVQVLHQLSQHGSLWFWEYLGGLNNPTYMHTLTSLLGQFPPLPSGPTGTPTPKPTPKPVVTPLKLPSPKHTKGQTWLTVVVGDGETLSGIAAKHTIQNWFADLFLPNKMLLDTIARQHGASDSHGGALIFPGTTLKYLQMT